MAHFVRIYENSVPPFVHSELLWSTEKVNLQRYIMQVEKGYHGMEDIVGVLNSHTAKKKLSKEEQNWIDTNPDWPYS